MHDGKVSSFKRALEGDKGDQDVDSDWMGECWRCTNHCGASNGNHHQGGLDYS